MFSEGNGSDVEILLNKYLMKQVVVLVWARSRVRHDRALSADWGM